MQRMKNITLLLLSSVLLVTGCSPESSNNNFANQDIDPCSQVLVDGQVLDIKSFELEEPDGQLTEIITGYELNGELIPHNICDDEHAYYGVHDLSYYKWYSWLKHGELFRDGDKPTKVIVNYFGGIGHGDAHYWMVGDLTNSIYADRGNLPNIEMRLQNDNALYAAYWAINNDDNSYAYNYRKSLSIHQGICTYYDFTNIYGYRYAEAVPYDELNGCDNEQALDDKYFLNKSIEDLPDAKPDRLVRINSTRSTCSTNIYSFSAEIENQSGTTRKMIVSLSSQDLESLSSKEYTINPNEVAEIEWLNINGATCPSEFKLEIKDANDGYIYHTHST